MAFYRIENKPNLNRNRINNPSPGSRRKPNLERKGEEILT
jgi:hypothetical protein